MNVKYFLSIIFISLMITSPSLGQSSSLGDTLMSFNAGVLTPTPDRGLHGVEFAEGYFWITGFDPDDLYQHKLYKFSADGDSLIDYWEYGIEFAGWKGLAYDGEFLYVADIDTIRQLDMETGQKTGVKIPGPEYYQSGLAYDPATDHFWVSGDGNVIYEIDRLGNIVNTIPFVPDLPATGLAWDTWTEGGPYLWVWSMKYTPSDVRPKALQIFPETGVLTGVEFEGVLMNPQAPYAADYALGATLTADLIPGKVSFIGMHASSYLQFNDQLDWLVAYDLDPEGIGVPGPQISVLPQSIQNNVIHGDSLDVPILIDNFSEEYALDWLATLEYPGSDTSAALGDTLLAFDASILTPDTNTRLRSIAYIGEHIFIQSGIDFNDQFKIYKVARDGSSVLQTYTFYSIFSGWRSMTSDDQFLYGLDQYSITKFDPSSGTVVESYPKTGFTGNAIAYDPQQELFYLGAGTGAIKVIDKQDNEVNFFVTPYDIEGLAWDSWSPGGPYLWACYLNSPDSTMKAIRLNPNTGGPAGIEFSGISLSGDPAEDDLPEDIIITPDWQENKLTMLALQESNTLPGDGHDKVVVYDLATTPPPGWIELLPPSYGNTEALVQDTLWVRLKAIMEDTLVVAQVVIKSNDVINPEVVIPVNFFMQPQNFTGLADQGGGSDGIEKIYPNPARDLVFLSYNDIDGSADKATIFSTDGKIVGEFVVKPDRVNQLNVSSLLKGLYIIVLTTEKNTFQNKLIIR